MGFYNATVLLFRFLFSFNHCNSFFPQPTGVAENKFALGRGHLYLIQLYRRLLFEKYSLNIIVLFQQYILI